MIAPLLCHAIKVEGQTQVFLLSPTLPNLAVQLHLMTALCFGSFLQLPKVPDIC